MEWKESKAHKANFIQKAPRQPGNSWLALATCQTHSDKDLLPTKSSPSLQ